jgi:hypothetical protein
MSNRTWQCRIPTVVGNVGRDAQRDVRQALAPIIKHDHSRLIFQIASMRSELRDTGILCSGNIFLFPIPSVACAKSSYEWGEIGREHLPLSFMGEVVRQGRRGQSGLISPVNRELKYRGKP